MQNSNNFPISSSERRQARIQSRLAAATHGPDEMLIDCHVTAAMLGIGVTSVWTKTKKQELPQPIRIGRSTRWRLGDIRKLVRS